MVRDGERRKRRSFPVYHHAEAHWLLGLFSLLTGTR